MLYLSFYNLGEAPRADSMRVGRPGRPTRTPCNGTKRLATLVLLHGVSALSLDMAAHVDPASVDGGPAPADVNRQAPWVQQEVGPYGYLHAAPPNIVDTTNDTTYYSSFLSGGIISTGEQDTRKNIFRHSVARRPPLLFTPAPHDIAQHVLLGAHQNITMAEEDSAIDAFLTSFVSLHLHRAVRGEQQTMAAEINSPDSDLGKLLVGPKSDISAAKESMKITGLSGNVRGQIC